MAFDLLSIANTIKALAMFFATIVISYAGLTLVFSKNPQQREEWKEVIAGVIIGLILLFLTPLIASQLIGATGCR
jgi:putative Mn2+ efflux pump MntP